MLPVKGITWRPKLFQNYIRIPACNDNGFLPFTFSFSISSCHVSFILEGPDILLFLFPHSLFLFPLPQSRSLCASTQTKSAVPVLSSKEFVVEVCLSEPFSSSFMTISSSCKEHGSPSDGLECARSPFHSAPKAVESSLWAVSGTTTAAATHPLTHPHSFCVCYPVSRPITPLTSQR